MAFLIELWAFLKTRKKFWLLPVLIMMVLFGATALHRWWVTAATRAALPDGEAVV